MIIIYLSVYIHTYIHAYTHTDIHVCIRVYVIDTHRLRILSMCIYVKLHRIDVAVV